MKQPGRDLLKPEERAAISPEQPLAQRFDAVRAMTRALAEPLTAEDCQVQSMPDASPVKWHLAHTTWFFETFVLERFDPAHRPFDPAFRELFNSYYQGVGPQHPRPRRGLVTRPTLQAVLRYRREVDAKVLALLAQDPAQAERDALIELGLQHEQQHQELILTDVKHLLSCNPLLPTYRDGWPLVTVSPAPAQWIGFAGGLVKIGHDGTGFAFDNEMPRHDALLAPFELADRLVTNAEYLEFIRDDGYRRAELWLSLGWDAVQAEGWQAPLYWQRDGDCWRVFTLHGLVDVDPWTPVCHLSLFEADAYARWAGARLPTEREWEHAVQTCAAPLHDANLLESGALHPLPLARESRPGGLAQAFGDVWEWTSSSYDPYPGFKAAAGAIGEYNGKFMCSQYVLRGGSCATPASHIRATYRNFFPPAARWQFSGLRLAR
ncbi:MAG TPA: ergothioneine biosynthesis protein EgtB [Burkholderiaceae bacterium]|nr:ergothioneine biosynthesis protein EgtB [Burkholderiaceae bacterium]